MNFRYIDYPLFFKREAYDQCIALMVEKISLHKEVESIYQIGSISNPGISDIDLFVVFKEGTKFLLNPMEDLNRTQKYLFLHSLFGHSRSHFVRSRIFSFFHNYKLLFGEEIEINYNKTTDEQQILKQQIALEYLLKMFLTLLAQTKYKVIKIRPLLLEVKALLYDLEFLKCTDDKLSIKIKSFLEIRDKWFNSKLSLSKLDYLINDFFSELSNFLIKKITEKGFFYPLKEEYLFGKNFTILNRQNFKVNYEGIRLPSFLPSMFGKKVFNLNSRLNSFKIELPIKDIKDKPILQERYDFEHYTYNFNKQNYPFFSSLGSSFVLK